jgi:peptidoglycan/LPS O-acetylase OafA/YrhL
MSVEAFYYAIFPAVYLRLARQKNWTLVAVAVLMCLLGTASSIWALYPYSDDPDLMNLMHRFVYRSPLRVPEFIIGVILGIFILRQQAVPFLRFSWTPALALLGLFALISTQNLFFVQFALVPLCAVLLGGLMCGEGWMSKVLSWPLLVLLGETSYSLYIIHAPIHQLYLAAESGSFSNTHFLYPRDFWLYLVIVAGSAFLVCHYVERPACRILRQWWGKPGSRNIQARTGEKMSVDPESADLPELAEKCFAPDLQINVQGATRK